MLDNKRVIAVVPARGGSKSVPGKNIKDLAGKPLIAWAIEAAKKTGAIDRVIVSTDDQKIAAVSSESGAEVYRRPHHLATDESLVIDTLRDLIGSLRQEGENAEIMVLLEATSPLRTPGDIQACLEKLVRDGLDSVATFHEAELNPHRAWKIRWWKAGSVHPRAPFRGYPARNYRRRTNSTGLPTPFESMDFRATRHLCCSANLGPWFFRKTVPTTSTTK